MKLFRKKSSKKPPARRRGSAVASAGVGVRTPSEDLDQRYAFRRNRTLTGSLSSDVESANVHHMELRSPRVHGHDLRAHRRRLGSLFVGVAAGSAVLGYIVYQSLAIPQVSVKGALAPVDTTKYTGTIQTYLDGHFLQRLRSTLDVNQLTAYLQEHGSPEVASIAPDISFGGLGKGTLVVEMRRPAVVWHAGSTVSYVDTAGNAFSKNYYAEPTVQIVDQTGIKTSGTQVLASNRFLGFVGKVIGQMSTQGHTVNKVVLPENTTRQVEVYMDGVGYPIKLSVDRPAGEQAEDAARAIKYVTGKGIAPEYLDVRVSGKAYYR